ncbi:hypothetical protein [Streptomyces sp. MH60]|uniref:hypothetical protein n=1 Tax=Streptomyces sp. MH60 TaxID=1940758 RepID=UPI000CEE0FEC|nr:hypothetical protein [Streptomyces sp. MH60]PPS91207.1 hypothetical protein BZZ08_00087 [Streptomyces sp. MH60]
MDALLPYVLLAGGLAAVLGFFTWLASRVRRRGTAGGAMGAALASYEEAFRATAYASHVEIRAEAERTSPLLSPDGDWRRGRPAVDGAGAEDGRTARRGRRGSRRRPGRWFGRRRGPLATGRPGGHEGADGSGSAR